MSYQFSIPRGFRLASLVEYEPEGALWMAYLREEVKSPRIGLLMGAKGRTPQDAITKCHLQMVERIAQYKAQPIFDDQLSIDDLEFNL